MTVAGLPNDEGTEASEFMKIALIWCKRHVKRANQKYKSNGSLCIEWQNERQINTF